jgi:hypothetical protein
MEHIKTGMEKVVTKEEMIEVVKSHGWTSLWNDDNWITSSTTNKDWGGRSLKSAYAQCVDEIEIEERVKQGKIIEVKI